MSGESGGECRCALTGCRSSAGGSCLLSPREVSVCVAAVSCGGSVLMSVIRCRLVGVLCSWIGTGLGRLCRMIL